MIRKALAVIVVVAMLSGVAILSVPTARGEVNLSFTGSAAGGWTSPSGSGTNPTITVAAGSSIAVTPSASDTNTHTWYLDVNRNGIQDAGEGTLDFQGGAATYRFVAPPIGTYAYHCKYHPLTMTGSFVVTGTLTLKNWPTPYVYGRTLNLTVVVGNSQPKLFNGVQIAGAASTIDVVGAVPLGFSLGHASLSGPYKAQLDIDAASADGTSVVTAGNIISIGGRAGNLATKVINPTLPVRLALNTSRGDPTTDGNGRGIYDTVSGKNYVRTTNADGSVDEYAFISFSYDAMRARYQAALAGLSGFSTKAMTQLVALNPPGLLSGTGIIVQLHDNAVPDGKFEAWAVVDGSGGATTTAPAALPSPTNVVQTVAIGNSQTKACGTITVGAASTIDVVGGISLAESLGRGTVKGNVWSVLDIEAATCSAVTQTGNIISLGGRAGNLVTRQINPTLPVRLALNTSRGDPTTDGTGRGIYVASTGHNYVAQRTTLPYQDYAFDSVALDQANRRNVRVLAGLSGFSTRAAGQAVADRTIIRQYDGVVIEFLDINGDGIYDSQSAKEQNIPATTIDYVYDNFFQIPYGEWWATRQFSYGDVVLTGQGAPGVVQGNLYPFNSQWSSNHYPWPGASGTTADCGHGLTPTCDALVNSNYHMSVTGRHVPGYNVDYPIYLPSAAELWKGTLPSDVQTTGFPAGGYIKMDVWRSYLTAARNAQLKPQGCSVASGWFDGYADEAYFNLTLDSTALQKVFGVKDVSSATSVANFFAAHTDPTSCSFAAARPHDLELNYENWFNDVGNNKYDIFNAFEYVWFPIQDTDVFYVGTTTLPNGQVGYQVRVHDISWGTEVLLQRWHYWGAQSYQLGVTTGAKPQGWINNELAWSEYVYFNATFSQNSTGANDFNFYLSQATQYALLGGGLTGTMGTTHDEPSWSLEMAADDYVPKSATHPLSELAPYYSLGKPSINFTHSNVGSPFYGVLGPYDYAPQDWKLGPGETLVVRLPTQPTQFYNPLTAGSTNGFVGSPLKYSPTSLPTSTYLSLPAIRNVEPAGLGYWDPSSRTFEVRGPFDVQEAQNPILLGKPFLEIGPGL